MLHHVPTESDDIILAAIEGGGTTFVVSVARVAKNHSHNNDTSISNNEWLQIGPTSLEILHTATFPPKDSISGIIPTWTPHQILDAVCNFLIMHRPPPSSSSSSSSSSMKSVNNSVEINGLATSESTTSIKFTSGQYSGVGIATFGPAGVHPHKPNYGTILAGSPKKEWRNIDILTPICRACGLLDGQNSSSSSTSTSTSTSSSRSSHRRVKFDTDVNAPALAEFRHRRYLQMQQQQQQEEHQLSQIHNSVLTPSPAATMTNMTSAPPAPAPVASAGTTATNLTSLAYVTVGTGVGVGLIINSQPVHGLLHPEGGHIAICPLIDDEVDTATTTFTGYSWGKERSPYEGINTVEGVASSVALTERYLQMKNKHLDTNTTSTTTTTTDEHNDDDEQQKPHSHNSSSHAQTREILAKLPDSHPIWLHAANAIANLCVSLLLLNSIQKIVLGGGIMKRSTLLFPMIRQRVWTILNGYLDCVEELSDVTKLDNLIVEGCWVHATKNSMGSGLVGAYALALDAYNDSCSYTTDDDDDDDDDEHSVQAK